MKRTSKILILVLSLALILGAVAVVASAATTGITTKRTENFDKLVGAVAKDGKNPSGTVYEWTMSGRWGVVEKGTQADGNNYLLYTNRGWAKADTPYLGTGYSGAGTTARPTVAEAGTQEAPATGALSAPGSIENYPYLVFEFDVASPKGEFAYAAVGVQTRYATGGKYTTSNGKTTWGATLNSSSHGKGNTPLTMGTNASGSYIYSNNKTIYVNPYEFNHVTVVFEGVLTDTNASYRVHTYLNGEYLASYAEQTNTGFYEKPHLTWDEVRLSLGSKDTINANGEDGRTIAFDNVVTRLVDKSYTGNLAEVIADKADITEWEDNIYDPAKLPAAFPVAAIGNVEYTTVQDALVAAKDGDTVKIINNVKTAVIVNNAFTNVTIDKGNYTVELVAGNGMELTSEGNVYTSKETKTKLFQYSKNAQTAYGVDTLAAAIKDADAGSTVKLLADTNTGSTTITIDKKIAVDLNGYTIKALTEGSKSKASLFKMTTNGDITLTSSVKGGKIFNEGWNSATGVGANGVFNVQADTASLHINGNGPDGTPYLTLYTGVIVLGYANAFEYHIDGGMYIAVKSDQQGLLDVRKGGADATVKNAVFYTPSNVFGYGGRNLAIGDSNIVMDNCIVIGNLVKDFTSPATLTVTNTYITGTVDPSVTNYKKVEYGTGSTKLPTDDVKNNTVGTVILGAGTYVGGSINSSVKIADGYTLHDIALTKDLSYDSHTWKASADYTFDASSFNVTIATKAYTFKKVVGGEAITATWKDTKGNILGTSTVYTGGLADIPGTLKTAGVLVEGWLDYIPAEWNESLIVPDDATEITFTEKEGGKKTPVVAVQLLLNIGLTTHFTYNMYIPVRPEGIELTGVTFANSTDRLGKVSGTYTIAGQKYNRTQAWPGLAGSLNDMPAGIKFTYEGKTYAVNSTVSMTKYCDYILNEENGYSEGAKILAASCANYIIKGNNLMSSSDKKSGENVDKMTALLLANADRVTEMSVEGVKVPDLTEISKYVASAQLVVAAYGPSIRFNLTDAGKAAKVELTAADSTKTDYATKGYIQTANNTNILNYKSLTLTVTPEGGEKISISYNLQTYYLMLAGMGGTQDQLDFISAMYAYLAAESIY